MKKNNKKRKSLYKRKKFLLMQFYGLSLAVQATSQGINVIKDYNSTNNFKLESDFENYINSNTNYLERQTEATVLTISNLANKLLEPKINDLDLNKYSVGATKVLEKVIRQDIILENIQTINNIGNIRTYYDFPCPKEWQDHIFKVSEEWDVPYEAMMTILHQESGGDWQLNGVTSITNDHGIAQINECNVEEILENTGITKDEFKYNPYKAIEAEAYIIKKFMNMYGYTKDNIDYENIFGTYNGWINWQEKEMSRNYAASCMKILEEKFGITEQKLR